ncbi:alpha/beta hydrolase [Actinomadura barringtoniae]|uniref:Alpha/beta hydrolase n=1 Tax=Actinomadura barringtoniae TaxID=1427535 RepID=A0A939T286_9ACTN|nr:alpha/beta fold hydrolase [Actinomadura barringtoniae]MBO2449196.1 alpha/beta hydrolase [Actinomadura barringtoniae]
MTFVLVHGAWHGAWTWDRVVPLLGSEAVTPELRLSGGLEDDVKDVLAALDEVDGEVILVGHSYGGMVVRQAADQRPEKVGHIVLVEGWAGPDGSALFDLAPEWFVDGLRSLAGEDGVIPALPPQMVGVEDPGDVRWLEGLLCPQPLRSFTEPTRLTGAVDRIPGTAIFGRAQTLPFADLGRALGYEAIAMDGPHDMMITHPEALAAHLRGIGDRRAATLE